MNKTILHKVANELKIPSSTIDKLNKLGLLKRNRILAIWNNILYKQGITKRCISSTYKIKPLSLYELAFFTNLNIYAGLNSWIIPKLIQKGIVTRYPPSKRKVARMCKWAQKVYFYTINSTSVCKKAI